MGVKVLINGSETEVIGYSYTEEATPVRGGDSSGSVGTFSVDIPSRGMNPAVMYQVPVSLTDSQYGSVQGSVDSITRSDDGGTLNLKCVANTADVAVFNITAIPFAGTLRGAIDYYISLGDGALEFTIPASIGDLSVAFMGWTGELWYHLKQLAVAFRLEIALVSGTIVFRTPGGLTLSPSRSETRDVEIGDNNLADKAEMYWYKTAPITNGPVYPPHKDLETAQTYSIPAGEETEIVLQLAASVSYVQQPVFRETVSPTWFSQSNISLTTESGAPVTYGQWSRGGGHARVEIQDDDTTVKLIIRGPTGTGGTTFRLAVAATTTHAEYSSIRLAGTGVTFRKLRVEVPTGVKPGHASSEMAPTEDNIFVNNAGRAWDLCTSLALQYSTSDISSSLSVPKLGLESTFGIAPGGRYYDPVSGQFFRARSATYTRAGIAINAELATNHFDSADMYAGMTYDQVQAMHAGKTYTRVQMEGVTRG